MKRNDKRGFSKDNIKSVLLVMWLKG